MITQFFFNDFLKKTYIYVGMYYVGSADWTTNLNTTDKKKKENNMVVVQAFIADTIRLVC